MTWLADNIYMNTNLAEVDSRAKQALKLLKSRLSIKTNPVFLLGKYDNKGEVLKSALFVWHDKDKERAEIYVVSDKDFEGRGYVGQLLDAFKTYYAKQILLPVVADIFHDSWLKMVFKVRGFNCMESGQYTSLYKLEKREAT